MKKFYAEPWLEVEDIYSVDVITGSVDYVDASAEEEIIDPEDFWNL